MLKDALKLKCKMKNDKHCRPTNTVFSKIEYEQVFKGYKHGVNRFKNHEFTHKFHRHTRGRLFDGRSVPRIFIQTLISLFYEILYQPLNLRVMKFNYCR